MTFTITRICLTFVLVFSAGFANAQAGLPAETLIWEDFSVDFPVAGRSSSIAVEPGGRPAYRLPQSPDRAGQMADFDSRPASTRRLPFPPTTSSTSAAVAPAISRCAISRGRCRPRRCFRNEARQPRSIAACLAVRLSRALDIATRKSNETIRESPARRMHSVSASCKREQRASGWLRQLGWF